MQPKKVYPIAALCLSAATLYAQPEFLDSSFNNSGKLMYYPGSTAQGGACFFTSGNKLLVAGGATTTGIIQNYFISAYDDAGNLVSSFGTSGITTDTFSYSTVNYITKLKEQADGKIVTLGTTQNFSGGAIYQVIARFNADGSKDASFGNNGWVKMPFSVTNDFAIQADGKILAGGSVDSFSYLTYGAIRLKTDGSTDSSFGTNGIATARFAGSTHDVVRAVGLQSDGKIILAGVSYFTSSRLASMLRLTASGIVDSSFGNIYGRTTLFVTGTDDYFRNMVINPDNSIVLAGNAGVSTTPVVDQECFVAKYTPAGLPDNSFNGSGLLTMNISPNVDANTCMALQPNNKILLGIYTDGNSTPINGDFLLCRINADGTMDTSLGNGGVITTDFSSDTATSLDAPAGVSVESDGRIAMSGIATTGGHKYLAVAKYLAGRPVLAVNDLARNLSLLNIFPNPVAASETLSFNLERAAEITITLTDMNGREVALLAANSIYTPGDHSIALAMPGNLPPGNYMVNLLSAGRSLGSIKVARL